MKLLDLKLKEKVRILKFLSVIKLVAEKISFF